MSSRREFVERAVAVTGAAALPRAATFARSSKRTATFLDLRRPPDDITVQTASAYRAMRPASDGRWDVGSISVTCTPTADALRVALRAPSDGVQRLHLRWNGQLDAVRLLLGDAWERAYGDLEWRGMAPDRVMPWYVAAWDGGATHGYGVRTGGNAFCFWQVDSAGISLWADVRSGGAPLTLGDRELPVGDVLCRAGHDHESPFDALHAFCRQLCAAPRLPAQPVYGHNDWYYAYGNNSAPSVKVDAQRIVDLSPAGTNRPFAVIDDGWQPDRGASKRDTGAWDRGNERFPDMAGLAGDIRGAGARPGIWIRPLIAPASAPAAWRVRGHDTLDPTVPEVQQKIGADIARLRAWGFDLIKHDYSTYDIMGRWGRQMGAALTGDNWTFAAGTRQTSAEVIGEMYRTIRAAAGDALVIGCNTVSHLSAGLFEMCRIGDDTSGNEWVRVPKMGVNALAFRGVQHGAFYVADPDCVGVTTAIPWALNRQWLDLLARSGTMTFVSLAPDAMGDAQQADVRTALARAATQQPLAQALDWQQAMWPRTWQEAGRKQTYHWVGPGGLAAPG
jgi:alpha-galactosidase